MSSIVGGTHMALATPAARERSRSVSFDICMIAFSMRRPTRGATEGQKQDPGNAARQYVFQPFPEDYREPTAAAPSTRVTELGQ